MTLNLIHLKPHENQESTNMKVICFLNCCKEKENRLIWKEVFFFSMGVLKVSQSLSHPGSPWDKGRGLSDTKSTRKKLPNWLRTDLSLHPRTGKYLSSHLPKKKKGLSVCQAKDHRAHNKSSCTLSSTWERNNSTIYMYVERFYNCYHYVTEKGHKLSTHSNVNEGKPSREIKIDIYYDVTLNGRDDFISKSS